MRVLKRSTAFRRDLKRLTPKELKETATVITRLQKDEPLLPKHRDHPLKGNFKNLRECHVLPDLLLVYQKSIENEQPILTLYRINSHSEIFE